MYQPADFVNENGDAAIGWDENEIYLQTLHMSSQMNANDLFFPSTTSPQMYTSQISLNAFLFNKTYP